MKPRHKPQGSVEWGDLLDRWGLIVLDLLEVYGVDLYDPSVRDRPWPWLRGLILGLLSRPSRLSRDLAPQT